MAPIIRKEGLVQELVKFKERFASGNPVYCICVGTDQSTGDAFGPLVGSLLQYAGYPNVIGTLERPCDSDTLTACLNEVPEGACVLAIDSVVGRSVGFYQLEPHPLAPGSSLGKPLPKIGVASLLGIVCLNRSNPYTALQTASLHRVLGMAAGASQAILEAFDPDPAGSFHPLSQEEPIGVLLHTVADRNRQK
ncbi:spore protease YyaC [Gorillibacterium timonense]|uniref:spore protease YyaC n=1 Tax=Gorillibacterium timonense TaxID=1689269 RepID=UPI00071E3A4A|nr:spore protease YyaC [Gorillibacterium timonense]